jgi:pyruvate,orthophosphate dikinase
MARLGLSVPPAFIATTELCRRYLARSALAEEAWREIDAAVALIEGGTSREFGDVRNPLLVSVRSGAPVSMPGMMDTILNIGLTEATLPGLAQLTEDESFAWDSYCRLLKTFGSLVRGISAPVLASARLAAEAALPPDVSHTARLQAVAAATLAVIEDESGQAFPQSPGRQLREAVEAVLRSWESPRARRYRQHAGIADDLGTAVIVQAMVFGNLDEASGSGVAFTRDPTTGMPGLYGDFLAGAQGEDVVSGEYDVGPVDACRSVAPSAYQALETSASVLEREFRDMCDIEFTVERGHLWVLQVRVGQRTGLAEVRIATDLLAEGLIDLDTAIDRISPGGLIRLTAPVLDPAAPRRLLGRGIPASPGGAVGVIATSARLAEEFATANKPVILIRRDTSPDDISGFIAAQGIATARGGRASHAAVVARGLNRPAVCSVEGLTVESGTVSFAGGETFVEGDELSLDGATGEIFAGELPLIAPELPPQVEKLIEQCDARRRIPVLSEEVTDWADGQIDPALLEPSDSPDELDRKHAAGARRLLIDVGASSNPAALIAHAATLETDARDVLVLVTRQWPISIRRLPVGPWGGFVTGTATALAARLLAATTERR